MSSKKTKVVAKDVATVASTVPAALPVAVAPKLPATPPVNVSRYGRRIALLRYLERVNAVSPETAKTRAEVAAPVSLGGTDSDSLTGSTFNLLRDDGLTGETYKGAKKAYFLNKGGIEFLATLSGNVSASVGAAK
jgi:hypothetical protein